MAVDIFGVAMTCSTVVNSAGLCPDVLGATLLFFFGLPPGVDRTGAMRRIAGTDPAELPEAPRYDRIGRLGLAALIGGFVLQLASNVF